MAFGGAQVTDQDDDSKSAERNPDDGVPDDDIDEGTPAADDDEDLQSPELEVDELPAY